MWSVIEMVYFVDATIRREASGLLDMRFVSRFRPLPGVSAMTFNKIWFLLVEVRALPGERQALEAGSIAELECYVPAPTLDAALPLLDEFLRGEAFE
jgi:hypothetical protein